MHNLYCTPLGETVRDRFTQALAEAIAGGRGGEEAYLLPSDFLLGSVRRSLAASGLAGHARPNLLAFDDLVKEIADLAGHRRHFMDRMTQELVVAKLLARLTAEGRLAYFGAIAGFPGYIGTVTSLLAEIKRSGASPEEFAAVVEARDGKAKDREVLAIYAAYQAELAARGLADLEERYLLAIDALEAGVAIPYKHFYISEFYSLSPLQLRLVTALRRVAAIDIGLIYEQNRPRVYAAVEATYTDLVGMGFAPHFLPPARPQATALAHIRRHLFADRPSLADAGAGVSVISAPGRGKEMAVAVAGAKKLLLAGDHKPEEIAIVVRDSGLYAGLRDIAGDYGLPLSPAWKEPLAGRAVARLLTAALAAKADGGSRHAVLGLVKSPLAEAAFGLDGEALEKAAMNRIIRRWRDWFALFKGRNGETIGQYRRGFDLLARQVAALPRTGACGRHAAALKALLTAAGPAAALGAAYRDGRLPLTVVKSELLAGEKCGQALDAMEDGFAAAGQAEDDMTTADFLKYFRRALAGQTVTLESYNERGVQVVSPAGVRGTTFRAVFLLGLTDGEFPLQASENWLYDDRERKELTDLGLPLPVAATRRAEEDLYFAVAAALAGERLTLSGHEDAQTLPSPYVAEVLRLFAAGAVAREKYAAGQFFADNYEEIYAAGDLAGKALLDLAGPPGPGPAARQALDYALGHLLDGDFGRRLAAAGERGRPGSPYDGGVGDGRPAREAYSITALECYAQCPFRYFAERVLRLEDWQEKDEEAGLDIVGTIYHEVLAGFLRAHRRERLRAEAADEYRAELAALLDEACRRLAAAGDLIDGRLWAFRRRRIEETLRRWLAYEISEQGGDGLAFTPAHLEWGFGLPLTAGMDEMSVAAPLELGDGRVKIIGKVDRVDAAGDKLAVIDYKRKYAPRFRELADGRDLQAALYIMAVEKYLCPEGGQVAGGGYYSVEGRRKDGGMWRSELTDDIRHRAAKDAGNLTAGEWTAVQEEIRRRVLAYSRGIEAGLFPVRPAAACPSYCVARTVCRYDGGAAGDNMGGDSDG